MWVAQMYLKTLICLLYIYRDVSYDDICLAVLSLLAHRQATSPNIGGVFTSLSSNRLNHDKQENINFTHKEKGNFLYPPKPAEEN